MQEINENLQNLHKIQVATRHFSHAIYSFSTSPQDGRNDKNDTRFFFVRCFVYIFEEIK